MEKPDKDKYYFSQSSLVDMERHDYCPKKWKAKWVDKEFSTKSTLPMTYGNYFEHLVIGENAKSDEEVVLPKNQNGSLTAVEKRLIEQATWTKEYLDKNYNILSVQERLYDENSTGILDILAVNYDTNRLSVIELKCTADVTNTRGPYSWGNYKSRDYIQLLHYANLVEKIHLETPELLVIVVDYSTNKGRLILELEATDYTITKCKERFESAILCKKVYDSKGYPTDASLDECSDCPLKCKDRYVNVVKKEKIII